MTVKCPDMHSKYTRPEKLLHSEKVNQNKPVLREANPYRELYLEVVEVEPEIDCDQKTTQSKMHLQRLNSSCWEGAVRL